MQTIYHLRIKEAYAAAVIEDLKNNDAVELITDEDAYDIPQWQKDEVRRRVAKYRDNPEQMLDEDAFYKMLDEE
ncbi:MAG: addiction module protein [Bacteroidota bacterium]